tara:strand:+ start:1935 stop:2528 length:594 start_codon:yes stop_codon:yes gene_type:complete
LIKINLILVILILMTIQPTVATQTNDAFQSSVLSEDFIQYMKNVENRDFKFGPMHESKEGGSPTYGFGHKLTETEKAQGKIYDIPLSEINEENSEKILVQDLKKANDILLKTYGENYINLDPRRKQMLIDFQFNVRNFKNKDVFPNFKKALFAGDEQGMIDEHVRGFYPSPEDRKNKINFKTLGRNTDFKSFFFGER